MTMIRNFSTFALLALLLNLGSATAAQREVEGIAAIVNDEVISLYDVDQRVDLFLVTSGIPRSAETVDRIRGQVLRSLVDEKLQLAEAKEYDVKIEKEEIDDSLKRMASQSNMTFEEIIAFLKESNIDEETLREQIRAELAWGQFVRRMYRGRITIGEEEINEQYQKAMETIDQPRYLINEILLPANNFTDDQRVQQLTAEIIKQLQAGIDFGAIARQMSISATAARGGEVGWVSANQLDSNIQKALSRMSPGQISSPIATPAGLYIIALRDKQDGGGRSPLRNQFDLLQVVFESETSDQTIDGYIENFKTCKRTEDSLANVKTKVNIRSGLNALGNFDPALRGIVAPLEAGQVIRLKDGDGNNVLLAVCERKDDMGMQISRDVISDNLFSQRLAMLSRRHLRNLQRESVVEYR